MARERLISAEQAVELVKDYPRIGQITDDIYIGRQWALNGVDQLVDLTAVRKGAVRLSEDSNIRGIILQRNPNLWGLEDAVTLRISRVSDWELDKTGRPKLETSEIVYRRGVACGGESDLARIILDNIARTLV